MIDGDLLGSYLIMIFRLFLEYFLVSSFKGLTQKNLRKSLKNFIVIDSKVQTINNINFLEV
jgi:hypothetical protein